MRTVLTSAMPTRAMLTRTLWLWALLSLTSVAQAQTATDAAGPSAAPGDPPAASAEVMTEAETHRLKTLSAELRCLVCQNQSLADSNADLAIDLRNQVRDQIRAGKSDGDIKEYLVQRYGEFVLYRPRVSSVTWVLWAGPFLLLALGAAVMVTYLRRRQHAQAGVDAAHSGEQLAQARALLRGDADQPSAPDVSRSAQERAP